MTMPENKRVEAEYAECDGQEAAYKYMDKPYWAADIPRDHICIEFVTNILKEMVENDTMQNEHLSREEWENCYFDGFMRTIRETRSAMDWKELREIEVSE
jgi:hypothetical protein